MKSILRAILVLVTAAGLLAAAPKEKPALQPVENAKPAMPAGVYEPSAVELPKPTFQARPRYPAELKAAGISGRAVVLFIVNQGGNVESALALRADDVRFADAAVEAVSKWRFSPAKRDGEPVNCRMEVPIVFATK